MRQMRIVVTHCGGPMTFGWWKKVAPSRTTARVRVRVLAAGVSLPDLMIREGIQRETPPLPSTPGWDLVGVVDRLGDGVTDAGIA